MDTRVDVAVIGTGPAGLSAAVTLKVRNKNILLIGNHTMSQKIEKAHLIQNYLGIPNVSGETLVQSFQEHLTAMDISLTQDQIVAIYAMGDYFSLQGKSTTVYEAKTVILATGISYAKLIPGEEQFLGRGVSYCATCDAALYRDKVVAVVGKYEHVKQEVSFLGEVCKKIYFISLQKEKKTDGILWEENNIETIAAQESDLTIGGTLKVQSLSVGERCLQLDGVFVLRDSVRTDCLVPGIAMQGNYIQVNRKMETNLPGCFACGDITGDPFQYIKAAGEGNVAALSAVQYLDNKHK